MNESSRQPLPILELLDKHHPLVGASARVAMWVSFSCCQDSLVTSFTFFATLQDHGLLGGLSHTAGL